MEVSVQEKRTVMMSSMEQYFMCLGLKCKTTKIHKTYENLVCLMFQDKVQMKLLVDDIECLNNIFFQSLLLKFDY